MSFMTSFEYLNIYSVTYIQLFIMFPGDFKFFNHLRPMGDAVLPVLASGLRPLTDHLEPPALDQVGGGLPHQLTTELVQLEIIVPPQEALRGGEHEWRIAYDQIEPPSLDRRERISGEGLDVGLVVQPRVEPGVVHSSRIEIGREDGTAVARSDQRLDAAAGAEVEGGARLPADGEVCEVHRRRVDAEHVVELPRRPKPGVGIRSNEEVLVRRQQAGCQQLLVVPGQEARRQAGLEEPGRQHVARLVSADGMVEEEEAKEKVRLAWLAGRVQEARAHAELRQRGLDEPEPLVQVLGAVAVLDEEIADTPGVLGRGEALRRSSGRVPRVRRARA